MNKTQTFEKVEKAAEDLRGLNNLSRTEVFKTPQHKKWKTALKELPKEKREEYMDKIYEESQKSKALYEKEIRPNTSLVHFWLGEKIVKEKKLAQDKKFIEESHIGNKDNKFQLESYATIFQNPNSKTPKFSDIEELGLYLFEPKEITKISEGSCNMKFETLYLKGNRCHDDLIKRVTDIIDICLIEKPPEYNPACASCKFVTSLKKEKYI